ncbi:GntR family transcriptional regulator [Streptomyces sp. NPDC001380]|uniref:GntR family transcriptional regulator n=1 Tax=Streptomyces sp. NPDC001380 TaxID=3364566 RepID=UPI0036951EC0
MSPKIERPSAPYIQITDHFRQEIQEGALREGDKLPSVAEIARTWGVAHATAAKAVGQLQVEGLILSSPRGSFVAGKAANAASPADRIMRARRTGSIASQNEHHRVTAAEIVAPPAYVAELLDLEDGAQVIRREVVTIEDKALRALTVTWYPASLAEQVPELLLAEGGRVGELLTKVEAAIGEVRRGRDFYHARGADSREAGALGLPVGSAILAGAWLAWADGERVVEYGETCLPPRATVSYPYDISAAEEVSK